MPNGQYEFMKTPFGLCNRLTSYDSLTKYSVISSGDVILTYMDDLIILGYDENMFCYPKLSEVLTVAVNHGLSIKWKKCKFLQKQVEFLGHIIGNGCVKSFPIKIGAVQNFPQPKSLKQLQSFLSLTSYFRKFVKDYAQIVV